MTHLSRRFALLSILVFAMTLAFAGSSVAPAVPTPASAADSELFIEGGQAIPNNDCAQLPTTDQWKCKLLAGAPSHRVTAAVLSTPAPTTSSFSLSLGLPIATGTLLVVDGQQVTVTSVTVSGTALAVTIAPALAVPPPAGTRVTMAALADADPSGGTTGYCVAIANDGHVASGGANGFVVTNATILSTSAFNNGSTTNTDDVYCAVIQATPQTVLPRPPVDLSFTFTEGSSLVTIHLVLKAVTVRLLGTDGVVGGSALVCTEGWDPSFLTGRESNTPPNAPNPLDIVSVNDWRVLSPAGVTKQGVLRLPNSVEQCVNLGSSVPIANISVAFDFYGVFNTAITPDDYLTTVSASGIVSIGAPVAAELRHVLGAEDPLQAQLVPGQVANTNVIGVAHYACVIPSVAGDTFDAPPPGPGGPRAPGRIDFISSDGAKSQVLSRFHDAAPGSPDFSGVANGTLCFSWTSRTPGSEGVTVQFWASTANPLNGTADWRLLSATWDANADGNPTNGVPTGAVGGMLIKRWAIIDHTVITTGGNIDQDIVTNGSVALPVSFNVADGAFLGSASLTEWIVGRRPGPTGQPQVIENLDGASVTLTIQGPCGYFETDPPTFSKTLATTSRDGRVQFTVTVDNDTSCTPGSAIHIAVTVAYPPGVVGPPIAPESVDVVVRFTPNTTRAPILRWAGQTATITYAFNGNCQNAVAIFTKSRTQAGTFVPRNNMPAVISGDSARVTITASSGCSASIGIENEDQGEVDVVAQLDCSACNPRLDLSVYSKVVFPFYFLQFEDLKVTVPEELTVSERGNLDAVVRGWFLGSNPSARPAERKADGTTVPAARWVLPDDWELLKGPEGFRGQWPSVADMPPAKLTFHIVDEDVRNDFKSGARAGSAGFFLPDELPAEVDINIDPVSGLPSVLGSVQKPRVISEFTDLDGNANIDVFGDLNLSFEGCGVNAPTGSPMCEPGNIAGRAKYYAIADYPELRGKHMPVTSNTVATAFTWQGYKRLTVEESGIADVRYVVAHLRDRGGFCDAISYNRVLGIPVRFDIDSGEGIITEVQGPPSSIAGTKRSARATTFDLVDDLERPINADIAKVALEDDECQAWIKITNSLLTPTNVIVHFPAQPVPVPGDIRITGLVCGKGGNVTVTNRGTTAVSLGGLAIRSANPSNRLNPEEHFGLFGVLEAGKSLTISGDDGEGSGWLYSDVFALGNVVNDYARLIWNETTISYRTCAGEQTDTPFPAQGLDGEGEVVLDTVVSFAQERLLQLSPGWNMVSGTGVPTKLSDALGGNVDAVNAIYSWDAEAASWARWMPGTASTAGSLDRFEPGRAYWVEVNRPFTLSLLK